MKQVVRKRVAETNGLDTTKYYYSCIFDMNNKKKYMCILDFYIPSKKIGIECQGIQHFEPIDFWGGEKKLEYIKKLDKNKKDKCLSEGIELIYYTECNIDGSNYIGRMFNNIDEIKKYINDTSNKT